MSPRARAKSGPFSNTMMKGWGSTTDMPSAPVINGVDCGLVIMKTLSCYVSKSELLANVSLFTQVAPKSSQELVYTCSAF